MCLLSVCALGRYHIPVGLQLAAGKEKRAPRPVHRSAYQGLVVALGGRGVVQGVPLSFGSARYQGGTRHFFLVSAISSAVSANSGGGGSS